MDVNQQMLNEMRVGNVLKILENPQLSLDNQTKEALINFINQYTNIYKTQYINGQRERVEREEYEKEYGDPSSFIV